MTSFAKEARDLAVDSVDRAIGYTIEFAFAPALHRRLYDAFEAVLSQARAAGVAEGMAKAAEIARAVSANIDPTREHIHHEAVTAKIAEAILAAAPPPEPQPQLTADQMSALEKAAYDKLPAQEDDGWRSEQEWQALLDGRDKFIVDRGLWSDFVRSL